ncbi:site-2 protease family protein [Streptomyces glaucescens]|uniref:site-2 protease family protein n=1 Tax=Streptomyces glaucescens TaxID=1907 RepID=UPI00344B60A1
MDESGGSGRPRSGDGNSTDHASPALHPTPDPAEPAPAGTRGPSGEPARAPAESPAEQPAPGPGPAEDAAAPGDHAAERRPAAAADGDERHPGPADPPPGADAAPAPDPAAPGTEEPPRAHTAPGPATAPSDPSGPRTDQGGPAGRAGDAGRRDDGGTRLDKTPAPAPASAPADDHERAHARSGAHGSPHRPEPGGGLLMGRPFGVPVYVAPSWFLVAILITWVFGGQLDRVLPELGAARYLVSLFFAVAFYASVLVHELAHTIAALRFKLPVRRIQLQFFGGVSEIEKEAETPGREFVLAFVGPLLSLVLAGVFYLAMLAVEPGTVPGVLLAGLMISNLIVAVFNLLPGLPLDGGRMLRAVVWKITGKPMSGTIAAAWIGRALAVSVLIGLPLLTQSGVLGSDAEDNVGMDTVLDALLAAILAAIIWTGAGNSLRVARLREHLPELRARALTRRAVPVRADTPLSEALRRANDAGARALVVVDTEGTPVALVREAAIVGVPEHRRPWVAVSGLAQELTDGMRVSAELAGEDLLEALRAHPATEYLVVEETGEIYGVLSAADVERAFVRAMARPS